MLLAVQRQQCLRERASVFRSSQFASLVQIFSVIIQIFINFYLLYVSCCGKPEVRNMATFSHVILPAVPVCLARCVATSGDRDSLWKQYWRRSISTKLFLLRVTSLFLLSNFIHCYQRVKFGYFLDQYFLTCGRFEVVRVLGWEKELQL